MLREYVESAATLYRMKLDYLLQCGDLVHEPVSPSSPSSGKKIIEVFGERLTLTNPEARFIYTPGRPLNIGFAIGNFLYQLSGRDDVDMLEYYNPLAMKFSDDGVRLHGAYGPRILHQMDRIIGMLTSSPGSRRAVVTVFDGRIDHIESKDVPCPVSMQVLVRDEHVVMLTSFRSQNLLMVFPYDIFLFTLLHEWIAVHLGLPMGVHIQFCGSLHIYEDEVAMAKRIAQSLPLDIPMSSMTRPDGEEMEMVFYLEKQARYYGRGMTNELYSEIRARSLSPYWSGLVRILAAFAESKRRGESALRDPLVLAHAWDAP